MEAGRRRRTGRAEGEGARDTLGLDTSGFLFRPRCLQPVRCVQSLRNHHGRPLHSLLPEPGDRRVAHVQRLQVSRASGGAPSRQTPFPHPGAVRDGPSCCPGCASRAPQAARLTCPALSAASPPCPPAKCVPATPTCSSTSWPVRPPACSNEELHPILPSPWWPHNLSFFKKTKKRQKKVLTNKRKIKESEAAEQELPQPGRSREWGARCPRALPGREDWQDADRASTVPSASHVCICKRVVLFPCVINRSPRWGEDPCPRAHWPRPSPGLPRTQRPLEPAGRIAAWNAARLYLDPASPFQEQEKHP